MIKVISEDRKKCPICVMFEESNIKPTWIELIQNIKGETKKWGGIKIIEKR